MIGTTLKIVIIIILIILTGYLSMAELAVVSIRKAKMQKYLETLDETQKRTLNPHTYPVGLERTLNEYRTKMVAKLRGIS